MSRLPYKQGIFDPINPLKYRGSMPIVFRSQLELFFCRWCDRNDNVLQWGSESIVIPYISPRDGKMHRYFVDFIVMLKTDKGNKKFLIEIKPDKQTRPPPQGSRMNKKNIMRAQLDWAINSCKWAAAKEWCQNKGMDFIILTEKDIKP